MTISATTEPVPCLCGHALARHATGAGACTSPACGCGAYRQHGGRSPRRGLMTTPAELASANDALTIQNERLARELDLR